MKELLSSSFAALFTHTRLWYWSDVLVRYGHDSHAVTCSLAKVADYGEDGLAIYEDGTRETQEDHNRVLQEEANRQGKDGER